MTSLSPDVVMPGRRKNGEPGAKTAARQNRRQVHCSDMENKPVRTRPSLVLIGGNTKVAMMPKSEPTPRIMLRRDSDKCWVYA